LDLTVGSRPRVGSRRPKKSRLERYDEDKGRGTQSASPHRSFRQVASASGLRIEMLLRPLARTARQVRLTASTVAKTAAEPPGGSTETLLERVRSGSFRADRHAHLLEEEELLRLPPPGWERLAFLWSELCESQQGYRVLLDGGFKRLARDEALHFDALARLTAGAFRATSAS